MITYISGIQNFGSIRDFIPQPGADDVCSAVRKQEDNGKGGHCIGKL